MIMCFLACIHVTYQLMESHSLALNMQYQQSLRASSSGQMAQLLHRGTSCFEPPHYGFTDLSLILGQCEIMNVPVFTMR